MCYARQPWWLQTNTTEILLSSAETYILECESRSLTQKDLNDLAEDLRLPKGPAELSNSYEI